MCHLPDYRFRGGYCLILAKRTGGHSQIAKVVVHHPTECDTGIRDFVNAD
jgi:hypothetical protein